MEYSLVIPCYNEAKNLPLLLSRCSKLIEQADCSIEVVIVNNGSSDKSDQILEQLLPAHPGCRVVQVDVNEGYGHGILAGLRSCSADVIGWTHADLQTDPLDVLPALAMFESSGSNLFIKGKRYGRKLSDVFFTIAMSVFETLLLRTRLWDINAQPTMFSRSFFETWADPPKDFSLDLYAYYTARRAKVTVLRHPVKFGDRIHGASSWNVDWASKKKFIKRTIDFSLELKRRINDGNHRPSNK